MPQHSELANRTVLFGMFQHYLTEGWSPSQIVGTLQYLWSYEPQGTVSPEIIYTCIYAMPKGEDRRDQGSDLQSIHALTRGARR